MLALAECGQSSKSNRFNSDIFRISGMIKAQELNFNVQVSLFDLVLGNLLGLYKRLS